MSGIVTLYSDTAKTDAIFPRTKVTAISDNSNNGLDALLNGKQATLVSGTNIKTINNTTLLSSGNMNTPFGIDASNLLASGNCYVSSTLLDYTPTVDCVLLMGFNQSGQFALTIDGVTLSIYNPSSSWVIPISAGQHVTHAKTANHSYWYLYAAK